MTKDHGPRLITPDQMPLEQRGTGTNTRFVCNILPETEPADSLLVVEVITPAGNWSSYPPHKHDTDNLPHESLLEETYYHRVNPPQGYVLHRVYDDDCTLDVVMAAPLLVPQIMAPVFQNIKKHKGYSLSRRYKELTSTRCTIKQYYLS